jgi:ABC-type Fe3+/spermidine/putrescine transport system ATPase subunit
MARAEIADHLGSAAQGAPTAPIIAAEGASKCFAAHAVLSQVLLAVRAREVVRVVGPSGSGKTTLLRYLALLEGPSKGRQRMNGVVIAAAGANATVPALRAPSAPTSA